MTEERTAVIPRTKLSEIVANRDAAVALYDDFFELLESAGAKLTEAQSHLSEACGGKYSRPYSDAREVEVFHKVLEAAMEPTARLRRVARRMSDIAVWSSIVERTALDRLMDKTGKDELRQQMAYVPEKTNHDGELINQEEIAKSIPPVTEESILATLELWSSSSGDIWRRGVAEAFSALDRRFRSHDGFKIGHRIVLSYAFDGWGWWNYHQNHRDTLLDIERVFLILDGKFDPKGESDSVEMPAYAGIIGAVEAARQGGSGARQTVVEGDYFRIRIFKNGNAHLWFTRKDLVKQVNQLLAEYYGAGLGWGTADQEDPDHEHAEAQLRAPAKNYGLFPSPDAVANLVIDRAQIWAPEGQALTVLEPSAGTGQLVRRVEAPHKVTAIEIQPDLGMALAGSASRVHIGDFLTLNLPDRPVYDRIIMNPPFDKGRDIDHVRHALKFLAAGGRLVSVMSASAAVGDTPKATAFREELEKLTAEGSGRERVRWEDLPSGSFREAGTNVNTALLIVQLGR